MHRTDALYTRVDGDTTGGATETGSSSSVSSVCRRSTVPICSSDGRHVIITDSIFHVPKGGIAEPLLEEDRGAGACRLFFVSVSLINAKIEPSLPLFI